MKTKPALTSLAAATLLAAAACGSDGSNSADDQSTEDAAQAEIDAFVALSAEEIAERAKEDTQALESVRFGGGAVEDGEPIKMDISVTPETCSGWMETQGFRMEVLLVDGQSWFRGDEAFWRTAAGAQADLVLGMVGDKWIVDADGEVVSPDDELCNLETFFESDDEDPKDFSKVDGEELVEVDGRQAIKIRSEGSDGPGVLYVAVEAPHYLLRADDEAETGVLTFTDFDEVEPAEAPAEDEQIDMDNL